MGALVENCDTLFDIFVIGGHYRMAERKSPPWQNKKEGEQPPPNCNKKLETTIGEK